jgi:hypothetical protein
MMPTSLLSFVTRSAPTFLSAINWSASKTVLSGRTVQTLPPLLCRISRIWLLCVMEGLLAWFVDADPKGAKIRGARRVESCALMNR